MFRLARTINAMERRNKAFDAQFIDPQGTPNGERVIAILKQLI